MTQNADLVTVIHIEYDIPEDVAGFLFELTWPGHFTNCEAKDCLLYFRKKVTREAGELLAKYSREVSPNGSKGAPCTPQ